MSAALLAALPTIALAFLKFALALLGRIDRNAIVKLGMDSAYKETLAEIIRKTGIAHEVDAEIDGLSDDAVLDRLSKYAKPDRGGLVLPGVGGDNLPPNGAASPQEGPRGGSGNPP